MTVAITDPLWISREDPRVKKYVRVGLSAYCMQFNNAHNKEKEVLFVPSTSEKHTLEQNRCLLPPNPGTFLDHSK